MSKPIEQNIPISHVARKELERKCQNRLNWSDAGYWIGTDHKLNCFLRGQINSTISHTYNFTTDTAASKWNLEWEKNIRYAGHFGTVALTVGLAAITTGMAGIAAGTLAAIIKDELQASISYPRMVRGSSYEVIFEYQFTWSPHPWGQRELKQIIQTISRDPEGKITNSWSRIEKYKLSELPDGLGRLLASRPSRKTQSDYR